MRCCSVMQAHQGFLRAFNSVTNATQTKNNIMEAWTTMSGVPAEAVTRWGALSACVGRSLCAHTMWLSQGCGALQCPAQACVSGPLALPQGAPAARRVLCAGFSLGAALATLCGPWAQATFPNVSPFPSPLPAAISLPAILQGNCRERVECVQSCSSP